MLDFKSNNGETVNNKRPLKGKVIEVAGEKAYYIKEIIDFFNESNFERILSEYEESKVQGAKFYIGIYSDEILESTRIRRTLKSKISNQDRMNLAEALDFVDGVFLIETTNIPTTESALEYKILQQRSVKPEIEDYLKKYEIGYASGAFSNLHKGHIEHLKEMKRQCKTTIVAVNSDDLIQRYKGKISSVNENARRKILSHIKYVDMAIITDEYDKLQALEKVKDLCGNYFNAIFAGSDWKGNPKWNDFEKRLNEMGIDVVFTDRPENGISTTEIDKNRKRKEREK